MGSLTGQVQMMKALAVLWETPLPMPVLPHLDAACDTSGHDGFLDRERADAAADGTHVPLEVGHLVDAV